MFGCQKRPDLTASPDGDSGSYGVYLIKTRHVGFTAKNRRRRMTTECLLWAEADMRGYRIILSILAKDGRSAPGCSGRRSCVVLLVAGFIRHGFLDLGLDGFQVEARAWLHRRKVEGCLGQFSYNLLYQHETPELGDEPVVIAD